MKKISVIIMFFMSITIFIHAQELVGGERKLTIYLIGIKQIEKGAEKNRLIMYDSNGAIAIDSLITVFEKKATEKGTIFWEIKCGIREIVKIESKSQESTKSQKTTIIFEKGVTLEPKEKAKLELPENRPLKGEAIKEAYNIWYIPINSKDTVKIDPYIDLKPPRN